MHGFENVFGASTKAYDFKNKKGDLHTQHRTFLQTTLAFSNSIIGKQKQTAPPILENNLAGSYIEEDFSELRIVKTMGKGGFGQVFQAINDRTSKEYALRQCVIDGTNYTQEKANKEISINNTVKLINNICITQTYSSKIISQDTENGVEYSLQCVMELGICTLEDVFKKRTREKKKYSEIEQYSISYMLINALVDALKYGQNHRDISLNNIILSNDLKHYKLIDFGEATVLLDKVEDLPLVGKWQYMSPEIRELIVKIQKGTFDFNKAKDGGELYSPEKGDVFSQGICQASVAYQDYFDGRMDPNEIKERLDELSKEYPRFVNILSDMLQVQPERRKKFSDLIKSMNDYKEDQKNFMFFEYEFDSDLKLIGTYKDDPEDENNKDGRQKNSKGNRMIPIQERILNEVEEFMKLGESNMRNNLFPVAIQNYLKAYEILKRANPNLDAIFETTIKLTTNIAYCQRQLQNYDEAANILRTCLDNVKKRYKKNRQLQNKYVYICSQLAQLLLLKNEVNDCMHAISEGLQVIDTKNMKLEEMNMFANQVELKATILMNLGYLDDAVKLFNTIRKMVVSSFPNATKELIEGEENTYKFIYCKNEQNLARVLALFSRFDESYKKLDEIEKKYYNFFESEDNDYITSLLVEQLKLSKLMQDYKRRKELIEKIGDIFLKFDHFRLMMNNDYMEFVKEKILFTLDCNKVDDAAVRVENILQLLLNKKGSYWHTQFSFIYSICLRKLEERNEALEILMDLYNDMNEKHKKLKNFRLFTDIHLEMSHCYYEKGEQENSLKCLKYIMREYYENESLIKNNKDFPTNLEVAYIYICIGNVYRKISIFEASERYLEQSEKILKSIFICGDKQNLIYGCCYENIGNQNVDQGYYKEADSYYNKAMKIYQEVEQEHNLGQYYIISCYKEMGNLHAKQSMFNDALKCFKESIEKAKVLHPDSQHISISAALNDQANQCSEFDKDDLAAEYFDKAIKINKALAGDVEGQKTIELSTNYHGIGNLYLKMGK